MGVINKKQTEDNNTVECLFWNIKDVYNDKRLDLLNTYAKKTNVIVLAEAYNRFIDDKINGFSLIQPLQTSGRKSIKIFIKDDSKTSFELTRVEGLYDKRVCVAKFKIGNKKDFFLIGVHLKSKVGTNEATQFIINSRVSQEIFDFFQANHNRAIIVGDFNHNPFEAAINSKFSFNSIPNREIVKHLKYRPRLGNKKTLFYNPMWNFLGDHDFQTNQECINGTYFFKGERHSNTEHLYWNLLDQVIVSEPLVDALSPQNIKIITEYNNGKTIEKLVESSNFISTKSYLSSEYSDHLPIKFSIDISKIN